MVSLAIIKHFPIVPHHQTDLPMRLGQRVGKTLFFKAREDPFHGGIILKSGSCNLLEVRNWLYDGGHEDFSYLPIRSLSG
jgi:hypothetical protein